MTDRVWRKIVVSRCEFSNFSEFDSSVLCLFAMHPIDTFLVVRRQPLQHPNVLLITLLPGHIVIQSLHRLHPNHEASLPSQNPLHRLIHLIGCSTEPKSNRRLHPNRSVDNLLKQLGEIFISPNPEPNNQKIPILPL